MQGRNVCKNVNSMLVARGYASSRDLCDEEYDWEERSCFFAVLEFVSQEKIEPGGQCW